MVRIGIRRAEITPPVGIPLVGFAGRDPSVGIHDSLYTTALVASDAQQTIAVVACDLLGIHDALTQEIREEVHQRTSIPPQHVMLACTHTHYGPSVRDDERQDVITYQSQLKFQIAGAVQEALEAQQDAQLGVGWGQSFIGVNRRELRPEGNIVLGRNLDGPIDRSVGVCRISTSDGAPLGTLVNFATHPVSQTGQMRFISADFPGQTRQIVEQLTGAPCLFLQGACGNINSDRMENNHEAPRSLGTRLGCEVVRVWETVEPSEVSRIAVATQAQDLPRYRYGSLDAAQQLAKELESQLDKLKAQSGSSGSVHWAELRLRRAKQAIEDWQGNTRMEPVPAEFQAYRLGNLAWATAPGEIFNELGQQVKAESPFEDTFFVGYANGSIGYVPVPEAYPEGGYEVTHACQVDPDASQILTHTCGELLKQIA